jgi:hypothetical protein
MGILIGNEEAPCQFFGCHGACDFILILFRGVRLGKKKKG